MATCTAINKMLFGEHELEVGRRQYVDDRQRQSKIIHSVSQWNKKNKIQIFISKRYDYEWKNLLTEREIGRTEKEPEIQII